MDQEASDRNHDLYVGFKGGRNNCSEPTAVQFKKQISTQIRGKRAGLADVWSHFATLNASQVRPITDDKTKQKICKAVLLPLKWAAELVDT